MDYTVKFSFVMYGDMPPLFKVADAIAERQTSGGVPNRFNQKSYEQAKERIYIHLMDDARNGIVKVCNQFGHHAPIADIVMSDSIAIHRPERSEIFALHVKQKHLDDWGALNGDTFIFQDTGYEDILFSNGSRGTIAPQESECLADLTNAVKPDCDDPSPQSSSDGLPTRDIVNIFDGVNGWPPSSWTRNLSASKWLHPARTALGGAGVANSMWNPLTLAQLLLNKTKEKRPRAQLVRTLKSRFNNDAVLIPWRDAFNEYFDTFTEGD